MPPPMLRRGRGRKPNNQGSGERLTSLPVGIMADIANATHLEVEAGVRYWEDATVNGVEEDDHAPTIYGADGNTWRVRIDLHNGRIENWPEGMEASVYYKVCDDGEYWLTDASGQRVAKWRGCYVPNEYLCHGAEGFGDYIIMEIAGDGGIAEYTQPELDYEQWEVLAP